MTREQEAIFFEDLRDSARHARLMQAELSFPRCAPNRDAERAAQLAAIHIGCDETSADETEVRP